MSWRSRSIGTVQSLLNHLKISPQLRYPSISSSSSSLSRIPTSHFSSSPPSKGSSSSSSSVLQYDFPESALEQPLDVPLPNLPPLSPNNSTGPSPSLMTTLPNGVRVCSQDGLGQNSVVGVLVAAGTRNENQLYRGSSQLLRLLAFKSTRNRSEDQMAAEVSEIGGNLMCTHSRESLIYNASVFRDHVPKALEIIADSIRNPVFTLEELEEQKRTANFEYFAISQKPENFLPEFVHSVAFKNNTLGNPIYGGPEDIQQISQTALHQFMAQFYQPSRLIVAGAGVSHDELVNLAMKHFGDLQEQKHDFISNSFARANFTGGFSVFPHKSEDAHLFIVFEGVSFSDPDLYATAVLQLLLGGGGSFSAGGPGKGMYSRLYRNVLHRSFMKTALAVVHAYQDAGLIGFHIDCQADKVIDAIQIMLIEAVKVSLQVEPAELARSRNQLKSSVLMNLESRLIEFEDLSKQVQLLGKRLTAEELCSRIDQVTADDVTRVAKKVFSSKVAVLAAGKIDKLPPQIDSVIQNFIKAYLK